MEEPMMLDFCRMLCVHPYLLDQAFLALSEGFRRRWQGLAKLLTPWCQQQALILHPH
jgi:hypothetical protein